MRRGNGDARARARARGRARRRPGVVMTPAAATSPPPSAMPAASCATIRGVDSRVSPPTTTRRRPSDAGEAAPELAADAPDGAGVERETLPPCRAVRPSRRASPPAPLAAGRSASGRRAAERVQIRTVTVTICPSRTRTPGAIREDGRGDGEARVAALEGDGVGRDRPSSARAPTRGRRRGRTRGSTGHVRDGVARRRGARQVRRDRQKPVRDGVEHDADLRRGDRDHLDLRRDVDVLGREAVDLLSARRRPGGRRRPRACPGRPAGAP